MPDTSLSRSMFMAMLRSDNPLADPPEKVDGLVTYLRESGQPEEDIQFALLIYRGGHEWEGTEVERRAYLNKQKQKPQKRALFGLRRR